jgi:hypothetical protein
VTRLLVVGVGVGVLLVVVVLEEEVEVVDEEEVVVEVSEVEVGLDEVVDEVEDVVLVVEVVEVVELLDVVEEVVVDVDDDVDEEVVVEVVSCLLSRAMTVVRNERKLAEGCRRRRGEKNNRLVTLRYTINWECPDLMLLRLALGGKRPATWEEETSSLLEISDDEGETRHEIKRR